ncbi:MAG TPA: hypothetical protein VK613_05850 [Gaiellaceae bacterium]|nr:hypothetical protein [Gaiellaceae bacterium]
MKPRITAAAGLAVAIFAVAALVVLNTGTGNAAVSHTCSATDRQFLGAAELNMTALGSLSQDYLQGNAQADDLILQTDSAATSLLNTNPSDPSLSKTQKILRAMFLEYGRAIRADKHHHDPGKYIYRAYGLANFAHDTLAQAQPALAKRGCDVSPLL